MPSRLVVLGEDVGAKLAVTAAPVEACAAVASVGGVFGALLSRPASRP